MIKKKELERYKEVNIPALNVRSGPSTSFLIIKIIVSGTVVECDQNFNDKYWDHIFAAPDIEGYCMKEYLTPLTQDKLAEFKRNNPIVIHRDRPVCDGAAKEKENADDSEKEE